VWREVPYYPLTVAGVDCTASRRALAQLLLIQCAVQPVAASPSFYCCCCCCYCYRAQTHPTDCARRGGLPASRPYLDLSTRHFRVVRSVSEVNSYRRRSKLCAVFVTRLRRSNSRYLGVRRTYGRPGGVRRDADGARDFDDRRRPPAASAARPPPAACSVALNPGRRRSNHRGLTGSQSTQ